MSFFWRGGEIIPFQFRKDGRSVGRTAIVIRRPSGMVKRARARVIAAKKRKR